MNLSDMIEVLCTADAARVEHAKATLAHERISCVAHAYREEESFSTRFLVPGPLAERARALLAAGA